jgi:hypothetical protein
MGKVQPLNGIEQEDKAKAQDENINVKDELAVNDLKKSVFGTP